jgi:acyl-CoA dehydrogenase
MAALLAYVVVEARARAWPRELVEGALAAIAALRALSELPPLDSATHIGLAGALRATCAVLDAADARFAEVAASDDAARRWARDRPLRDVASRVRERRLEAAWKRMEAARDP